MAIREILLCSKHKEALRKKSKPVQGVSKEIRRLVRNLKDTLNSHTEGVGLATPQINVHKRVVIVRLRTTEDENDEPGLPIVLINPEIIEVGDECWDFDGCLSFPGLYGKAARSHYLKVTGLDENSNSFEQVYEGFDAVVVHHEIAHLDGILFIDHTQSWEDLYTVQKNESGGELVCVPMVLEALNLK